VKLSIIVPVYNVEAYLRRCVESVLKQDYKDYEIILVDDGSTDNSGKMCDELAQENEKIKVIHKENGGLSSARNVGINAACGKYIMLLDSDDWIADGCLMKFSLLMDKGYDLIMGRAWTIDDDGNKKDKIAYRIPAGVYSAPDSIEELTAGEVSFCSQFYIYRTDYVNNNSLRFLNGILHEDELWMPIALLKAETIYVSDIYFYYHYVRKGSIMHSKNYERSAESTLTVCKHLNEEYKKYPNPVTKHLRDRMAMLFLRSVPQLNLPDKAIEDFGRTFALRNSSSTRQKLKAIYFAVAPKLYCKQLKKIRGY